MVPQECFQAPGARGHLKERAFHMEKKRVRTVVGLTRPRPRPAVRNGGLRAALALTNLLSLVLSPVVLPAAPAFASPIARADVLGETSSTTRSGVPSTPRSPKMCLPLRGDVYQIGLNAGRQAHNKAMNSSTVMLAVRNRRRSTNGGRRS